MDRLYRIPRKWWMATPLAALLLVAWLITPSEQLSDEAVLADENIYPPSLLAPKSSFQTVAFSLEPAKSFTLDHDVPSPDPELQHLPGVETTPHEEQHDDNLRHAPPVEPEELELSLADDSAEETPAEFAAGLLPELRRTPAVTQNLAPKPDLAEDGAVGGDIFEQDDDIAAEDDIFEQAVEDNSAYLDVAPPASESIPYDLQTAHEHRHMHEAAADEVSDDEAAAGGPIADSESTESFEPTSSGLESDSPAVPPSILRENISFPEFDDAPPEIEQEAASRPLPNFGMSDQQLVSLSRTADRIIEAGVRLAARGATYSARTEFVMALRMIAQGLDAQEGGKQHSKALSAAFRAMRESEGFTPRGVNMEADIDMAILIAAHRTPVLKSVAAANLTPMVAIQSYYTYAQDQFALAGGRVGAASHALFSLGKLQQSKHGAEQGQKLQAAKAMAFHQSALLVDARNHLAANELGVLLAQYEQWDDARRMLLHSVSVAPIPETWHNLAVVHQRLGQTDLAHRAQYEEGQLRLARNTGPSASDPNAAVRWVSPEKFARSNPRPGAPPKPQTARRGPTAQPPKNAARPAKSKKWGWW